MVRSGARSWRAGTADLTTAGPRPVRCAFEFRLPDGTLMRATAPGRVGEGPGDEPPQPALYDPRRPGRALLLSGLSPVLRVGTYGGWETTAGPEAPGRLLLALLLLAVPVVVGLLLIG
jgi:hypothetical protein